MNRLQPSGPEIEQPETIEKQICQSQHHSLMNLLNQEKLCTIIHIKKISPCSKKQNLMNDSCFINLNPPSVQSSSFQSSSFMSLN